jgi:hypothetical protein
MKSPLSFISPSHGLAACLTVAGLLGPVNAPAQRIGERGALRPVYDQWTTYLNPKFGYQVPVPPGLRAQSDPLKGGSCRFASDDGTVVLKAWGTTLTPQPGDPLENPWREAVNLRGRRIDFQRRSRTGFVLAGLNGDGSEFYEKVVLSGGVSAGMNVSYPVSLAARYAPWVDEIERGFGWRPDPAALLRNGGPPPPRGFFSGIREYFTGEEAVPEPRWRGRDERPAERSAGEPVTEIRRDPDNTKVDLTPPPAPPGNNSSAIPLEQAGTNAPSTPPPSKPAPAKREDLPYGIVIPGKKGYVYSPYGEGKQQVDVTEIPTGTKVKCPYTGKVFRVP